MSQVNDALKRVRDTQQSAPRPSEAPQFRLPTPAPAPTPARGIGLIPPIVFAVVALLGLVGLILIWQLRQRQTASVIVKPAAAPAPIQIASIPTPRPALPPKPALPQPAALKAGSSTLATAAVPVPPRPNAVIKLQGILYSGRNSTAMISGQTVMAGDEVGGYRVTAIGQRSVTLVNGKQTNVLSLNP